MEPLIYLVTGVMASGKSTVGQALAQALPKAVHLRGDVFRKMVVSGRAEMDSQASPEALAQLSMRYKLAAQAAKTYFEHGFTVVLQDNYLGEMLGEMLCNLKGYPVRTVVLCPNVETVKAREAARGKRGYVGFTPEALHEMFMRETPRVGLWLDTSRMTAQDTVRAILSAPEGAFHGGGAV